jgi:hypothetical protein
VQRGSEEVRSIEQIDESKILKTDHEIAIAAPGRSKAASARRDFPKLWEFAREKLAGADRIVFLGYGFPKTDALARGELISAIRSDQSQAPERVIEVVLGPEIGSAGVQRVVAILRATKARRWIRGQGPQPAVTRYLTIRPHPMWVEDYIGDFAAH